MGTAFLSPPAPFTYTNRHHHIDHRNHCSGDGNGWWLMAAVDTLAAAATLNATASAPLPSLATAFTAAAEAWLAVQHPSGMWHQLLDDPTTYLSASATGWAVHGLVAGMAGGFLDEAKFGPAAAAGWAAVAAQVQPDGAVANLSPGFGILGSKSDYLRRTNSSLLWGYGAVLRACAAVGRWTGSSRRVGR